MIKSDMDKGRSSQIAVSVKLLEGVAGEGMYVLPFKTMVSIGSLGVAMSWEDVMWAEELVVEVCWPQAVRLEAAYWAVRASSREHPAIFPPGWMQNSVR